MKPQSFKAFTWQEFLIVLSLIAILAAILFPMFAHVRSYSGPGCPSREKQIALGFAQYVQDYDERYPPYLSSLYNSWDVKIFPYCRQARTYQCPDDLSQPNDAGYHFQAPALPSYPAGKVRSYAINADFRNWPGAGGPGDRSGPLKSPMNSAQSTIPSPQSTILLAERHADKCNEMGIVWCQETYQSMQAPHTSVAYYAFCDGHAKALAPVRVNTDGQAGVMSVSGDGLWDKRQK